MPKVTYLGSDEVHTALDSVCPFLLFPISLEPRDLLLEQRLVSEPTSSGFLPQPQPWA